MGRGFTQIRRAEGIPSGDLRREAGVTECYPNETPDGAKYSIVDDCYPNETPDGAKYSIVDDCYPNETSDGVKISIR